MDQREQDTSIYGPWKTILPVVMEDLASRIRTYDDEVRASSGDGLYEHLALRVKDEESMRAKCREKGLPETPASALLAIHDAIGLRVVCRFVDDVDEIVARLHREPGIEVVTEKDFIRHAKPNGYRSYHLVLSVTEPFKDICGNEPGHFLAEVQLRTIAQDTWAALEHQIKYKRDIDPAVEKLAVAELKRVADELASCDVSMQTIRALTRNADIRAQRKEM